MRLEELRQLDIMPFDCGSMADGMGGHITEKEDTAQFAVMLRYLDLLAGYMGIPFDIPLMHVCLKRDVNYGRVCSDFYKSKAEIMKRLYDNIMLRTGWSYGICKMSSDNAVGRNPKLSENGSIHDWGRAISLVPEILELKRKGFRDITITVCWSERVARYCKYAASNPKKLETVFGEEAAMVRRILRKMADPYATGDRIQCHKGNRYVMAYYEGRSDEVTVSSEDMDYNFYVQGMVLHVLLSRAEELFGLPGMRQGDER